MKRLGMFTWFFFLMSMCFLKIDDGEGAGGSDDIFDEELDDNTPLADDGKKKDGDGKKEETKPPAKETTPDPDKMLLDEIRQERVLNQIIKEFTKEYGDGFNMDQVIAKLEEMEKENPGSGNKLFNKAGIELVHLKYFANQEAEGEFDGSSGRSKKAPSENELIEKINKGEASDKERTALFAQFV